MKWNIKILVLVLGLFFIACSSTRDTQENLTQEGMLKTLDEADPGSSIIYTEGEEKAGNYDVKTSLDYNEKNSDILYTALVDRLRKIGGLTITGTGDNVSVLVRGMSSIKYSNQPIYVIDGFNVGDNYARANGAVDVNQIKSIRVLKDLPRLPDMERKVKMVSF